MMNVVRRVLRAAFDSSTPSNQAQVEVLADELRGDVEVADTYGVTSYPPDDVDEGIMLSVGGHNDHGIVISWIDKTYRPTTLEKGEVVLYSKFGQTIKLNKLGEAIVKDATGSTITLAASGVVQITPSAGSTQIIGSLQVTQGIAAGTSITAPQVTAQTGMSVAGKNVLTHTHSNPEGGVVGGMQ